MVTVSVLEPNLKSDDIKVDFALDTIRVTVQKQGHALVPINGRLYDAIDVDKCKVLIKAEKVNIKLRKRANHNWHELFGAGAQDDLRDKEAKKNDEHLSMEERKARDEVRLARSQLNHFLNLEEEETELSCMRKSRFI